MNMGINASWHYKTTPRIEVSPDNFVCILAADDILCIDNTGAFDFIFIK